MTLPRWGQKVLLLAIIPVPHISRAVDHLHPAIDHLHPAVHNLHLAADHLFTVNVLFFLFTDEQLWDVRATCDDVMEVWVDEREVEGLPNKNSK